MICMKQLSLLYICLYQGTVSTTKFRKRLTKIKITIALPKKFGSKLRYVYPIWGTAGDIAIRKREIDYIKIKIVPFIVNFGGNYT